MATIEFFFDFSSPYSYLASTQIEQLALRSGTTFAPKPFVVGAVFKAVGSTPAYMNQVRSQAIFADTRAWARDYDVPFRYSSHFPFSAMKAHRMVVALPDEASKWRLSKEIFRAAWAEDRDVTDPEALRHIANGVGLDGTALLAKTEEQAVKDALKANTDSAIERGAYGAPTFFVGGEMFMGNDRLAFVERAARGEQIYPPL